jgi:hypothetical protein
MRSLSLKTGLLLAMIPAAAAFAAGEQQEDKSYLPPASLSATPDTKPAVTSAQTAIEPRRHARAQHRRHEARSHSYRRYAGPAFFYFPF